MTETIPQCWQATVKPFFQRAHDFESRDPVIAYFLRRHVVFICMKNRPKGDAEAKIFLTNLLDKLEAEGKALGDKAHDAKGKAALVYTGLKLFAKADEQEKAGVVALPVIQLFFTSALLLEATSQFTEENVIPSEFVDKCKYAKYVATRMKRSLDGDEVYVNPTKTAIEAKEEEDEPGALNQEQHSQPQQQQQQQHMPTAIQSSTYIPSTHPVTIVQPSTGLTCDVTVEQMIDAQKYARQAVSALQFYDAKNAVMQLEKALATLRGGE